MQMITDTFGIQSLGLGYFRVFVSAKSDLIKNLPDNHPMEDAHKRWGSLWGECWLFINYCLTGRKHWFLKEGYEACVNNCIPPMNAWQKLCHEYGDQLVHRFKGIRRSPSLEIIGGQKCQSM